MKFKKFLSPNSEQGINGLIVRSLSKKGLIYQDGNFLYFFWPIFSRKIKIFSFYKQVEFVEVIMCWV